MAHATAVINVVGLSSTMLGYATPHLTRLVKQGRLRFLEPMLPAVTSSVQASMVTGVTPREHGIVGNGWYYHDTAEVAFWKQSNRLVTAEKVWETARRRDPSVTTANVCWWFNMYSSVEYSVTPRPIYKADGRKIQDCYAEPPELRDQLQAELGPFPLFRFWGPAADITSSRWIVDASIRIEKKHHPTLLLVYLPHLDYGLQKLGPEHPAIPSHVEAIDAEVGRLVTHLEEKDYRIIVLSEYGIEPAVGVVKPNVLLREAGLLRVRDEQGHELLDAGASRAFAVCDHQVAHVYVKDEADLPTVRELFDGRDDVALVLDRAAQAQHGIDHARAGDLVLMAAENRWFSYRYWLDDRHAPDFARCVDIHRKPGYDPCELFIDRRRHWLPLLSIAWRLTKKKLGFRTLMDVIALDESLVKGTHGRTGVEPGDQPVLITSHPIDPGLDHESLPCTAVRDVILAHLFGAS